MKKFLKGLFTTIFTIGILLFALLIVTYREKSTLEDKYHLAKGSGFIELPQGRTEYEIAGPEDGEPVVLVHGFSIPMFYWDSQFNKLVDEGYRVLRYNHYGRGFSDRPKGEYDKKFYLKQLNDIIKLNFNGKVNLIGHSMGGALASEYTSRNPDMVDKLILISPALNPGRDNLGVTLVRIPYIGEYFALTIITPITNRRADELLTRSTELNDNYLARFKLQNSIKGYIYSIKQLFRNGAFGSYENAYNNLNIDDVMLIWGDEDGSVLKDDTTRIISLIPGVEKRIYHGVGHAPHMEIAETVNRDILTFLQQ